MKHACTCPGELRWSVFGRYNMRSLYGGIRMRRTGLLFIVSVFVAACATDTPANFLDGHEEVDAATVVDAPSAMPGSYAPENRAVVQRGEYMVELLGCGACHTDGALVGTPDMERPLAGSQTGIAYTSPLDSDYPGVVYPPNITPDAKTGIGDMTDVQIGNAVRAGIGRHVGRRIAAMPWQGYAKMSDEDVHAIVSYLRSIRPVRHEVPDTVPPGRPAKKPFVYFGVYQSK